MWRDGRTGRTAERGEHVHRLELQKGDRLRVFEDPRAASSEMRSYVDRCWEPANEVLERLGGAPALTSDWHDARAKTHEEIFDRAKKCGESEGHRITLVCKGGCKHTVAIEVGCGSMWFCPGCRVQRANKFRKIFDRNRLGILTAARRAGLMRRNQKRGERWDERFITFTLPHRGTVEERLEIMPATLKLFMRKLRRELRPSLQGSSGISFDVQAHNRPNGRPANAPNEMKLLDLLTYFYVLEWTPGSDGLGHYHAHVWMFSRYLDNKELLHRLWTQAYFDVRRAAIAIGPIEEPKLLIPHVERCDDNVGDELIKYMLKDWDIGEGGAKRVAPDVFARVYAKLDGKRLKQSSAGFAKWGVEKANVCPCCGYENLRGHWARVDIEHTLDKHEEALGGHQMIGHYYAPDGTWQPMPLTGAGEIALRVTHDAKRDADFLESTERRVVRARMQELGFEHADPEQEQPTEDEEQWQTNFW